jgi:hypothetical protein
MSSNGNSSSSRNSSSSGSTSSRNTSTLNTRLTPTQRFEVIKPKLEKQADKEFTQGSFKNFENIVKYIADQKGEELWTSMED